MIDLDVVDDVSVVTMRGGENRFNLDSVTELTAVVARAAERQKPMVITGEGKFFSNGLDLDWLGGAGPDASAKLFPALYSLMADVLTFPGATAAAINGHAFGAGLILSACADFRAMRADRGYFCFPEVDLGMAMSDQFDAIIKVTLPAQAMYHALITGHRYGADEAQAAGFVHAVAGEDQLIDTAVGLVREMAGKNGETVGRIKAKHFEAVASLLRNS